MSVNTRPNTPSQSTQPRDDSSDGLGSNAAAPQRNYVPLGELAGDGQQSGRSKWLVRSALGGGVVAAIAVIVVLTSGGASKSNEPQLTHTIKRGDLRVTVTEQGMLESSDNTEIKCKVRGKNTVIWVIEGGTIVEPGDELVRLDTLALEDAIAERTKYSHWSRSGAENAKAAVASAELAISEYTEGRYPAQMMRLEKDLAIAEQNLLTAQAMFEYAADMKDRGYRSEFDVQDREFRVRQAELNVEAINTQIEVLAKYEKQIELETLRGDLAAAKANYAASAERAVMDEERRVLAVNELEHCVIKAERSGMVIYPSAAKWETAPDIEEGATVHKDQILLLMPDLTKMQVKVGVHESVVDRVKPGLKAIITLPDKILEGEVTSVASVTQPAGWWTGNVVKYDTIVQLPSVDNLKPGMSAEVELLLDEYTDVITIPVAAVVETDEGHFCWVKKADGSTQKRPLQLGDSNDVFIVVEGGLKEGDEVVLNPLAYVDDAQSDVIRPVSSGDSDKSKDAHTNQGGNNN